MHSLGLRFVGHSTVRLELAGRVVPQEFAAAVAAAGGSKTRVVLAPPESDVELPGSVNRG